MLNQKIREAIAQFRRELPPELSALIEQGAGEISALDISERALGEGAIAPVFGLANQNGQPRALADYLARGPLVLTFYRGIWCPYCNLQIREYAQRLGEIRRAGAQLVALSPEKPQATEIYLANGVDENLLAGAPENVPFDILHDERNAVARAFGLVFTLPESHRRLLSMLKVDVVAANGDDSFAFPDPATYVIAPNGVIAWAFVPNNYRRRAEVEHIINAVRRLAAA